MLKYRKIFVALLVFALCFSFGAFAKSDNANQGSQDQDQNQNQNQNQKQNQGEETQNQEQNQEQENEGDDEQNQKGQINAEEHRSVVSDFVQELQSVADNQKGGIGEQVRLIAQEQNQAEEETTIPAIEKIQKRSKIKTFLIGSDYKNLGALRSEMVQTRNRIEQLTRLMEQTKNTGDKTELQNQLQVLEQERTRIEEFIKAQEGKFSLFGWLVRLFTKE